MERDIFWDVFRDTGDPLCWLLTRRPREEQGGNEQKSRGERKTSPPLS